MASVRAQAASSKLIVRTARFAMQGPVLLLNVVKMKTAPGIGLVMVGSAQTRAWSLVAMMPTAKMGPSARMVSASIRSALMTLSVQRVKTVWLAHASGPTIVPGPKTAMQESPVRRGSALISAVLEMMIAQRASSVMPKISALTSASAKTVSSAQRVSSVSVACVWWANVRTIVSALRVRSAVRARVSSWVHAWRTQIVQLALSVMPVSALLSVVARI